jgi:redox-sensitive bicupin YhaK (pirin superfamily)
MEIVAAGRGYSWSLIMLKVRHASQRGQANYGWLDTRYTFSFADYYDSEHMGFSVLRVMNEDKVAPGRGFGMHPHRDMEIVTWVLEGGLEHKDSLGHGAVLRPGEAQRITAGTGIQHSEFNPSKSDAVHLYQIWLLPDRPGHPPGYDQKPFPTEGRQGRWQVIVSGDGRDGSLTMHQDASIRVATLPAGQSLEYQFGRGRNGWLQVLRGGVTLKSTALQAGDGLALSEEPVLAVMAVSDAELMLFDLP